MGICLTPGNRVKALLKRNTFHARMALPYAPHKQDESLPAPINKHHRELVVSEGSYSHHSPSRGVAQAQDSLWEGESHSHWLVPVTLTLWCLPSRLWLRLDGQLGVFPIKDSPFSSFPFCLSLG